MKNEKGRKNCRVVSKKRKIPYHNKYDHTNLGTKYAFNWFYEFMFNRGVKSSMVACCGEDYSRYVDYANMIATGRSKAYFAEKFKARYSKIHRGTKGHKNIIPMKYNVFHYMDSVKYKVKHAVRVLDLGLGIGIKKLLLNAAPLLQEQSLLDRKFWKVQLLDSAIRYRNSKFVLDCYTAYLKTIGLEIESINGINVATDLEYKCLKRENAIIVKTYFDGLLGKKAHVYQHNVVLKKNDRHATLIMFECINGSTMLQSMLLFK